MYKSKVDIANFFKAIQTFMKLISFVTTLFLICGAFVFTQQAQAAPLVESQETTLSHGDIVTQAGESSSFSRMVSSLPDCCQATLRAIWDFLSKQTHHNMKRSEGKDSTLV